MLNITKEEREGKKKMLQKRERKKNDEIEEIEYTEQLDENNGDDEQFQRCSKVVQNDA